MESVNILIAIEYQIVRDGIKKILHDAPDIAVAGCAKNIDELMKLPFEDGNILVLDLDMPNLENSQTVPELAENYNELSILGISDNENPFKLKQFMQSGGAGYLLKKRSAEELIDAIKQIYDGGRYLCDKALSLLVKADHSNKTTVLDLTEREVEVLVLICQELTNREIADKLGISVRTVDAHRRNMLQKTGAKNTAGLVKYAIKHHIFSP